MVIIRFEAKFEQNLSVIRISVNESVFLLDSLEIFLKNDSRKNR